MFNRLRVIGPFGVGECTTKRTAGDRRQLRCGDGLSGREGWFGLERFR